jgi:very-short-patch-repair endonuclease
MIKEIPFEKSFASHEKSKYWSDKNELKPYQVSKASKKKYWFECEYKHLFECSRLSNITYLNQFCPECNKINKNIKFNYTNTSLIKYCKNNNIILLECYTTKKVNRESIINGNCINYDKCNNIFNKTFRLMIDSGAYCDICTSNNKSIKLSNTQRENNKLILFENSLACHEKSKYFSDKNLDKNGNLINIHYIPLGTHDKFLFNCNICNHEFNISIDKLSIGRWCPYCCIPQKKLCGKTECISCFEKSFASNIEKVKYYSNKNIEKPEFILKNGDRKIIFDCDICNHSFETRIKSITDGVWCPYCAIPSKILCENNNCNLCFEKSFASHEKSKYWSDKNKLSSRQIFKNAGKIFLFNCNICNHEFEKNLNSDSWCSYCSSQKLCDNNDCKDCFDKSFASHEKSKYWSDNNELLPRQVFKYSNSNFLFNCDCGHLIEKSLNNISNGNSWCPYCCNPTQKLCDNNNCILCFENSFASHEKSKYWSDINELKPRQVFKHTSFKYLFNCNKCNHKFNKNICSITSEQNGWCPYCINKTEQKLYDKIVLIYPELIQQYKVEWCKNITYLPFDFCIEKYKIIIELDGRQHFEQVSNWNSPEENQHRDKFKMKCANDNNYSVIRILQEDVFYDTFDWINEIKQAIQKIIDDKIIQNIFICKNNEYDIFNDF